MMFLVKKPQLTALETLPNFRLGRIKLECNAAAVYKSSKLAKYKKTGEKNRKGYRMLMCKGRSDPATTLLKI